VRQEVLDAADVELGVFHGALVSRAVENEAEGGGGIVTDSARRAAPYLMRQSRWSEASTLLERLVQWDKSPAALAFVLPLLERIVHATAGTEQGLEDAAVLANALGHAGRFSEAEARLRALITESVARGNYRLASTTAGDLATLLRKTGRLDEALAMAEEKAGYTQKADLGPWTQLADEGRRLQVLAALGRDEEVLKAVETLRPRMQALPKKAAENETAIPYNVRESLLDTGHTVALNSERWEKALELNADIQISEKERGAGTFERAQTRFNDYGPLLQLQRYGEVRELLQGCRKVFEDERAIRALGNVYSALANLEDKTGGRREAVRFETLALRFSYQEGEPESCAISHHNLSNYLARQDADRDVALAHRLGAASIRLQTRSGRLASTVRNLAKTDLPALPPAFTTVADHVEAVEGVRFRALFERLPRTVPDGDAAIAAVWQMVAEERAKR
jgi:tetratricopeptide (TPR) repeat protein